MKKSFGLIVALALIAAVVGYYVLERGAPDRRSGTAAAHADEIFRSPTSAVAGNPNGDVNVVAFFDYNCPYCRKDVPALNKLITEDGNVRLVLKELPVLGPDSVAATRLVLAARRQGKEHALHQRLIGTPGRVNRDGRSASPPASGSIRSAWRRIWTIRKSPRRSSKICGSLISLACAVCPSIWSAIGWCREAAETSMRL